VYYSGIGMLATAVLLIVNYEVLKPGKGVRRKISDARYRHFLFGVLIYYLSDILWGILYEQKLIVLAYVDTVIYFLAMVTSVILWTRFVVAYLENHTNFGKVLIYFGGGITLYAIIALIMNFFQPIVFGFSKDLVYIPGKARYVNLFIQMMMFLMASGYTLMIAWKSKGESRSHHLAIGFSGLVMTIFIALQARFPLLPFYAMGCLLATCLIHTFVYRDETAAHSREMGTARKLAYSDPMTGVLNKLAYLENVKILDDNLKGEFSKKLGIVVFDLNGLKTVNDTKGHEAGDTYIIAASRIICRHFKHSHIYRIGGDEFVAILEDYDYDNREAILKAFNADIERNQVENGVVIAGGLGIYDPEIDRSFNDVFQRADRKMYERKGYLKGNEKR